MANFMDLSFNFIIHLYRAKVSAEQNKDGSAIASLNQHYPELFSSEFTEFIENVKLAMRYLDQKYGQIFYSILEPSPKQKTDNLH